MSDRRRRPIGRSQSRSDFYVLLYNSTVVIPYVWYTMYRPIYRYVDSYISICESRWIYSISIYRDIRIRTPCKEVTNSLLTESTSRLLRACDGRIFHARDNRVGGQPVMPSFFLSSFLSYRASATKCHPISNPV